MVSGIALLFKGGAQGGFFIIFPFIISSGPMGILGSLLLTAGIILLFFGIVTEIMGYEIIGQDIGANSTTVEKRGIGLVMVGPVPLIIDSKNRKLSIISLIVFIIGIIILYALFFL